MAKYCIHTYPGRCWYVEQFLFPSMLQQGIAENDIIVYNDVKGQGNLVSCMNAFSQCTGEGGTWHIQDDVLLSRKFKETTEKYDSGIVCGFRSKYDEDFPAGWVTVSQKWWSFPCIRIPNDVARECAEWFFRYMQRNPVYKTYTGEGKCDDWIFFQFLKLKYPQEKLYNLDPNIVEHVDWLIGGSSLSKRKEWVRSVLWSKEDEGLVEELEVKLRAIHRQ